jgi:AraC-like DNA-binding protein
MYEKSVKTWLINEGKSLNWLAEHLGMSRATLYRQLRKPEPSSNYKSKFDELLNAEPLEAEK